MASDLGISTIPPPLPQAAGAPASKYESFIDQRLSQTRRQVKATDIAAAVVALAASVLIYLFVATLLDHWLISSGLGFWGRVLLWLGLLGLVGAHVVYKLLPPLTGSVNPLFAAAMIEHSRPGLRNSIINFLLLRRHRTELAPPIYEAVERRAAVDLARVPAEAAVDRSWLIRLSTLLAVVLALCCLYLVLSPKSMLRSTGRVLWPWAELAPPTRVEIRDVRPGNVTALQNDFLTVSAEISGLREDETPLLYFSTADGQSVDQAIPLLIPEGEYRYQCRLPPGQLGFQQDYYYYLKAGDAQTRLFHIEVQIAPTIVVEQVDYHYPSYTGLAPASVKNQGDLRAIEGTAVTLHASANVEIKRGSAEIDLGCTGRRGVLMNVEGRTAVGRFTLRPHPEDAFRPEFDSYQLRFTDLQGRENRRPSRHRIEVIPDLPPEIQLLEPVGDEIQVPVAGRVDFSIRAEDPDFALRRVDLRIEREGRSLAMPPLLEKRRPAAAWPGEFTAGYQFRPADFNLKPGDQLLYWAEAEDNKEPLPNRSMTVKRRLVIIAGDVASQKESPRPAPPGANNKPPPESEARPDGQQEPPEGQGDTQHPPVEEEHKPAPEGQVAQAQQEPGDQKQSQEQPPTEPQAGAQKSGQGKDSTKSGEASEGRQQGNEQSQQGQAAGEKQQPLSPDQPAQPSEHSQRQPNERIDPDAAPGDAIQEILNERRRQEGESSTEKETASKEQPASEKSAHQQQKTQPPEAAPEGGTDAQSEGVKPEAQKSPGEPAGPQAAGQRSDEKPSASKPVETQAPDTVSAGEEKAPSTSKEKEEKVPYRKEGVYEQPSGSLAGGEKEQPEATGEKQPGQPPPGRQPSPTDEKQTQEGSPAGQPPEPQEQLQPDARKSTKPGQPQERKPEDEAPSPSISKKPSSAQGDTHGERAGGGGQGGGQQAPQPGKGQAGEHEPADEGSGEAKEPGEGEIGSQAGDQPQEGTKSPVAAKGEGRQGEQGSSDQQSGPSPTNPKSTESDNDKKSSTDHGQPDKSPASGKPRDSTSSTEEQAAESVASNSSGADGSRPAQPGGRYSGRPRGGGPTTGEAGETEASEEQPLPADQAKLEYARRQTELALEYLREQLAKETPPLLERLGWTKEEAQKFLERWEALQRAASEKGPAGQAARKQLDEALLSLGLRPRGTELRHGSVAPEKPDKLREHGRFTPPPDWAEQFRAYTRGITGADRMKEE